jgi:tRNA/rRNA methyltransferase
MLDRIRIVLVETSHPGNVGSCARAMKTMGLSRLVLASPAEADLPARPEALALASGAADLLETARQVTSLDDALQGVNLAIALTARGRELGPPALDAREAALQAVQAAQAAGGEVAFVFGSERTGLSNAQVLKCQRICHIPTDSVYSSLNLAQAVQIVAYELRMAAAAAPVGAGAEGARPVAHAGADEVEALLAHLEEGLIAIRFLDPQHPKRLMPRLRRLFARAHLEREEVDLLRGVAKEMLATAARARSPKND